MICQGLLCSSQRRSMTSNKHVHMQAQAFVKFKRVGMSFSEDFPQDLSDGEQ